MGGQIIGIIGTIVVVIAIIVIAIVWVYLKKRSKPDFILKQGPRVFCREAKYMKDRQKEIEEELDRGIELFGNSDLFKKEDIIKEFKNLSIIFKPKPFKPETNVFSKASLLNGICNVDERYIVVVVPKEWTLRQSAMLHELCHMTMFHCAGGLIDYTHANRKYWKIINE